MCDDIVILRRPRCPRTVYQITSSAFTFDVKSDKALGIYLSEDVKRKHMCWIAIGINHSEIRNSYGIKTIIKTPNAINADRFKSFWISWNANHIRVGREGNYKPFMEIKEDTSQMRYVAFNIMGSRRTSVVRLNLAPVRPPEKIIYFNDDMPKWIRTNKIPFEACIGGYGKELLYVIRATHYGSLIPGKFDSSTGMAYISSDTGVHVKTQFEVLCGYNFEWVRTSRNRIPVNALQGGQEGYYNQEPLYVGRAEHAGCLIPGKVQPSHKWCYIVYKNEVVIKEDYEILVAIDESMQNTSQQYLDLPSSNSVSTFDEWLL